jgi:hypothetical protein
MTRLTCGYKEQQESDQVKAMSMSGFAENIRQIVLDK